MGLIRMVDNASICSLILKMPISAAMAEPARRDHNGGEHRPQFHDQGQRNQRTDRPLGAELYQRMMGLQPQNHACEQADQDDDADGSRPDEINLLNNFCKLLTAKNLRQSQKKENGRRSQMIHPENDEPPHFGKRS